MKRTWIGLASVLVLLAIELAVVLFAIANAFLMFHHLRAFRCYRRAGELAQAAILLVSMAAYLGLAFLMFLCAAFLHLEPIMICPMMSGEN